MITKELIDYVHSQRTLNKTDAEIKQDLLSAGGWSPSDIDEVFGVKKHTSYKTLFITSLVLLLIVIAGGVFAFQVQKLAVTSPHSPTPSPISPSTTNNISIQKPTDKKENGDIILLVQASLTEPLSSELSTYAADVKRELGWNVVRKAVAPTDDVFSLKDYVKNYYETKDLRGVLFIGDVPTGEFYNPEQSSDSVFNSEGYFLSDAIYQDLLDACIYSPKLKAFDYTKNPSQCANGTNLSPYWVARLTPNSTTESSVSLLKNYFVRNHAFRTGQISFSKTFIGYLPMVASADASERTRTIENFKTSMAAYNTYTSPGTAKLSFDDSKQADDEYLSALAKPAGAEAVLFNGHGAPTFHQHNITPSSLSSTNFVFLNLLSCSVGRFTTPDYLGGKYLFSGGLIELSATTPVFATSAFDRDAYEALSEGVPFYKVFNYTGIGDNILGDPTLKLRYDAIATSKARITVETKDLSFSKAHPDQILTITNTGTEPLLFNGKGMYLIQKDGSKLNSFSFVQDANIVTGNNKANSIAPGKTGTLSFQSTYFFPYDTLPQGEYKAVFFIVTNDNTDPFTEINLNFKV